MVRIKHKEIFFGRVESNVYGVILGEKILIFQERIGNVSISIWEKEEGGKGIENLKMLL